MACEYCNGTVSNRPIINMPTLGVVVVIEPDVVDRKPMLKARFNDSFDAKTSYVSGINYCPMCGEKLGVDHE